MYRILINFIMIIGVAISFYSSLTSNLGNASQREVHPFPYRCQLQILDSEIVIETRSLIIPLLSSKTIKMHEFLIEFESRVEYPHDKEVMLGIYSKVTNRQHQKTHNELDWGQAVAEWETHSRALPQRRFLKGRCQYANQ